jgi:hypothetical protein
MWCEYIGSTRAATRSAVRTTFFGDFVVWLILDCITQSRRGRKFKIGNFLELFYRAKNSNIEIRNPKQITMTEISMFKTRENPDTSVGAKCYSDAPPCRLPLGTPYGGRLNTPGRTMRSLYPMARTCAIWSKNRGFEEGRNALKSLWEKE